MIDFIEGGELISSENKKQLKENRKVKSLQKNSKCYEELTGEFSFDVVEKKKELIDNLNMLKSMGVEEFTFYKKCEEIKEEEKLQSKISSYSRIAKAKIWSPTDINDENLTIKEINNLQPRVVFANDYLDYNTLWTTLRIYCHTADFNQSPGRFIKFLIIDDVSDKILGVASVASELITIPDRDKFIGWTREDKLIHNMLNHTAIATTILPTQPLGFNFLGGKLIASLMTTQAVRDIWKKQEGGSKSKGSTLVGMTTTSLYGPFSMYNSLKWWKPVGSSKGRIPIHPDTKIYTDWHAWLKQNNNKYVDMMKQKEGVAGPVTSAKMRILGMIFGACKIKMSTYFHDHPRGVYWSEFYENSRDFLCRKFTDENKLVMKPLFKGGVDEILKWWKPKAISRYLKLKSENRLNPKKLFYNDVGSISYEEAKNKYLDAVGRKK